MTTRVANPAQVPEAPLVAPGDAGGLHNVFRERYLLKLLVRKELKARYQQSVLGLVWSYVQPAVRFSAYYFVIGYVFQLTRGVENFPLHIFSGMVMVHLFSETFSSGTRSIIKNKGILKKLALPREMFPIASFLVTAYHIIPQGAILLLGAILTGWSPGWYDLICGILGFSIIATFGIALALLFSAMNVFFRDMQNIVQTIGIFVTWSAPMIYPYDRIKDLFGGTIYEQIYLSNPIASGVILFEQLFWFPTVEADAGMPAIMPDHLISRGLIVLGACLLLLAFAQWTFARLEGKFAERL